MDKKILHLITHLKIGGAQRLVLDIAKNMPNVKVLAIKEDIRLSNKLFFLVIWRIYQYLKKEKPVLVHTHLWHADVFGGLAAIIAKVPFVSTEHSINLGEEGFLKHLVKRCVLGKARFVIAISRAVAEYLEDSLGVAKERIKIIYNGVDEAKFRFTEYPRNEIPIVACLGRLEKRKGQDILIEALKDLRNMSFLCWIIGDGSWKNDFIKLAEKYHLQDKIKFLGARTDIPEMLGKTDFLVMPSRQEGLGLAAIEAALVGRPTIAFAVGGLKEVIENSRTGFLVHNQEELESKIKNLLTDRNLCEKMGKNAYQFAKEKFTLRKMLKEYQKLYAHIANQ